MLDDIDREMLKIAYDEAARGFDEGGCPIGSVIARDGREVARVGIISAFSKVIRSRMEKWMRCVRQAGRKPIVIPCCIQRSAPA